MKYNERELPFLDQALLDTIFEQVYNSDTSRIIQEPLKDFLNLLYALQDYNYRYRSQTCATLFSLFEETIGPMKRNSEGTTMWLALGLAIKELYGLRHSTLEQLLRQVTVRK